MFWLIQFLGKIQTKFRKTAKLKNISKEIDFLLQTQNFEPAYILPDFT